MSAPKNFHTRISKALRQSIFKISMQGPLTWIQRRSPQDLLTRTCARSCEGLSQHFTRISTRSFHKELYKTLTKIFAPGPLSPKRISQDRHKRTCCCWRGSYCKILIQEPPKSIPEEELSYKHLKKQGIFQIFISRNSYTWHLQHLHARTSWRISTGSSQNLQGPVQDLDQELHTKISKRIPQDHQRRTCYREDPARPLYKNLLRASHKSFHRSTSNR